MSFHIVIQCPLHPTYQGKISPATSCKACRMVFAVRNSANRVLSTPREERTDVAELIVKTIE